MTGVLLSPLLFLLPVSFNQIFLLYSVIIVAMVVVLVTVSRKWDAAFCCPDCGGAVDDALDTEGKEGAPILRLCPVCDVLWETGHTPSD